MLRTLLVLGLLAAGCASGEPPSSPASADPPPLAMTSSTDRASVSRTRGPNGPTVTVNEGEGNPVAWKSTLDERTPAPFDPATVRASLFRVLRRDGTKGRPGPACVEVILHGVPSDAVLVELQPRDSEVRWPDGAAGTVQRVESRNRFRGVWELGLLTDSPSGRHSAIPFFRAEFDLHQVTRARREEAVLRVGDTATFDFGTRFGTWVLSEDSSVTEFIRGSAGPAPSPLFARGLRPADVVSVLGASGLRLVEESGDYRGSSSIKTFTGGFGSGAMDSATVSVLVPLEWKTTRVVALLENLPIQE